MIIKPVDPPKGQGGFARLVRYMVRAKGTERCTWFSAKGLPGVDRAEAVEDAIRVVEAFQSQNHRAALPTYHMVIAFDPRDRSLDERELGYTVEKALRALGFEEHQYVAVRHSDQEHEHIHVAVNRIHPETLRSHHPRRDIMKLMQVATELECNLGLHVVENRTTRSHDLEPRARDYEGHTGVQSFERWAKHDVASQVNLSGLAGWHELHNALGARGLRIVPRGNGMAVVDAERPHLAVKASALGREWSKAQLSKRFGAFVPGLDVDQVIKARVAQYELHPLRPSQDGLWQEYQQALAEARGVRQPAPHAAHRERGRRSSPRRDGYHLRHALVRALPVSGHDQFNLHRLIEVERRARVSPRNQTRSSKQEIRPNLPHPGRWLQFLSTRALEGDPRASRRLKREAALPEISGRPQGNSERPLVHACFRTSRGSRVYVLPSGQRLLETRDAVQFAPDSSEETLRSALELAKRKFGARVTLSADEHLRQRLAHLCAASGIEVRSQRHEHSDRTR